MRITRVRLYQVAMALQTPFQASTHHAQALNHLVVAADGTDGLTGWGECAVPNDPYYMGETTGTCWHILHDFLIPSVIGKDWETIDAFIALWGPVKANHFAKTGLEMAACDLLARAQGKSLSALLGGTRKEILAGVSLGIERDFGRLCDVIDGHLAQGYRRVKLKIAPGHDLALIARMRDHYPTLPLMVDANSAYTLRDAPHLKALDQFHLIMIEQPLAWDDIIEHARLQAVLETPICLDESIRTLDNARHAIGFKSCRIINIKVPRVGGLMAARAIHDLCRGEGVTVWCGGMHDYGIGRAANVAIASLPDFSLPGDISGSDKYFDEDIVEPPIRASNGTIAVPTTPGLGWEPVIERIERRAVRRAEFP